MAPGGAVETGTRPNPHISVPDAESTVATLGGAAVGEKVVRGIPGCCPATWDRVTGADATAATPRGCLQCGQPINKRAATTTNAASVIPLFPLRPPPIVPLQRSDPDRSITLARFSRDPHGKTLHFRRI